MDKYSIRRGGNLICECELSTAARTACNDFINDGERIGDAFQSEADRVNEFSIIGHPETRRKFIKQVAGTSVAIAIGPKCFDLRFCRSASLSGCNRGPERVS
jgi:hypothetical protein